MEEQPAFEIVKVTQRTVVCDGGNPAVGHPQVYLQMRPDEDRITCPYCSRTFQLSKEGRAA